MLFKVTKFNGRKDRNAGQVRELSWHQFVHFLKQRRVHPYKWGESEENENAPLFSPVEYASNLDGFTVVGDLIKVNRKRERYVAGKIWKNAQGIERHTDKEGRLIRCNENVVAVHMVVFDFDSKPEDEKGPAVIIQPGDIVKQVDGLNFAIYSTHNSTKALPRFRLVLPLKEPLSLVQFKGNWPFGFEQQDQACKDLARMYLMPSCTPELQGEAFLYSETEKKYFMPKLDGAGAAAKEKRKKKKPRGDYDTLDAVTWFTVHGCEPVQTEPFKYAVNCPWVSQHTNAHQGPTDTTLWVEPNKWPTFHCSHSHCAGRNIESVMALWGDQDEYCARPLAPEKIASSIQIKALGHDDVGKYYYQCSTTNHIVGLKPREHQEREFYGITPDINYWMKYYGDPETGKVDWKKAARDLIAKCHTRGFFKPQSLRGGGVWRDNGRLVVHLGKSLLVDGKPTSIFEFDSDYVYEAMVKEVDLPEALSQASARKVYDLIMRLPFRANGHAALYAGMVVCGYLSGILAWRPHIWLTGEPGAGKSTILEHTLGRLWTPMGGIVTEGVTTEAGLRQVEIRHNAVPVVVDEGESNDRREIDRVAAIVRLARSASSDSSARVVKGNSAATGHTYTVRCCFVLASIVENLEHEQDKERFSVLELVKSKASAAAWPALRADLDNLFTKDFALGLYARMIELAGVIRANAATFGQALAGNLQGVEPRWADQYGHLLGAAWTLMNGTAATLDQAWAYYQSLEGIKELSEKSGSSIPQKALSVVLAHIPLGQSRSLGELVEVALGRVGGWEDKQHAEPILLRYGLRVREDGLFVSSNHPQTEKIFKDAGFPGHYTLLARIEGATKGHSMRFGLSSPSKAVRIPLPKPEEDRSASNGHQSQRSYATGSNASRAAAAAGRDQGPDELPF